MAEEGLKGLGGGPRGPRKGLEDRSSTKAVGDAWQGDHLSRSLVVAVLCRTGMTVGAAVSECGSQTRPSSQQEGRQDPQVMSRSGVLAPTRRKKGIGINTEEQPGDEKPGAPNH